MKSSPTVLLVAVVFASVAAAQTAKAPTNSQTPIYAPPQQPPTTDQSSNTTSPRTSRPSDGTDCTSRVRASNPRLSAEQAKEYCQRDLNRSSPQD
jgi:hypothetical protein